MNRERAAKRLSKRCRHLFGFLLCRKQRQFTGAFPVRFEFAGLKFDAVNRGDARLQHSRQQLFNGLWIRHGHGDPIIDSIAEKIFPRIIIFKTRLDGKIIRLNLIFRDAARFQNGKRFFDNLLIDFFGAHDVFIPCFHAERQNDRIRLDFDDGLAADGDCALSFAAAIRADSGGGNGRKQRQSGKHDKH